MDDSTVLKEIEKMLVSFAQKQKEERDSWKEAIIKSISVQKEMTDNKLVNSDDGFLFDTNIKVIDPISQESLILFRDRLKELMKQSGVVVVNALLNKKF